MLTPAPAASPNIAAHPRCTGIAARFHAGSVAVCRAGAEVALHLATTQGEVVVTMREIDFVRGARGAKDHNGVPFRTVEQLDVEKRREQEAAELPPPPADKITPSFNGRKINPDTIANCEKAWLLYLAEPALTQGRAAVRLGLPAAVFNEWVRTNHAVASREIRRERWGSWRTARKQEFAP